MTFRTGSGSELSRAALASCALALFTVAGPRAFAIGPNGQYATVTANKLFTDGRPIHWQDSTTYGTASCTNAYVVDVTYSALAPLPGTYLSWGDDEPGNLDRQRRPAPQPWRDEDLSGAAATGRGGVLVRERQEAPLRAEGGTGNPEPGPDPRERPRPEPEREQRSGRGRGAVPRNPDEPRRARRDALARLPLRGQARQPRPPCCTRRGPDSRRVPFRQALERLRAAELAQLRSLERHLPVSLSMSVQAERSATSTYLTFSYGTSGAKVTTMGFEGLIRPNQTRVNDPLDLRSELHEPTHVYNYHLSADQLPSWPDEGFAIQTEVQVAYGGDSRLMMGPWRFWKPGDTDGHLVGSGFFRRPDVDYACRGECAAQAWRDLVDAHGSDTYLTDAEIEAVFEAWVGADLSPVFATLGLDSQRYWYLPSSARAARQGGSFYRSDLTIANRTATDTTVTFEFLGHDVDGCNGVERSVSIRAGQAAVFEDVLGSLFGISSGYGATRVGSTAPLTVQGQT